MLTSQMCAHASLTSPELLVWSDRLRPVWDPDSDDPKPLVMHRKMWEWLFIAAALDERGMLESGRRGLGFGVGLEPLVALFAARGCEIVATDLGAEAAATAGWTASGQEYAGGATALNQHGLCRPEDFERLVSFREVDMRNIPEDLRGFDFTWSSCALEHLGTLSAGMDFVEQQLACLRPGGVAVHTTELNVSSDRDTVAEGATVLYRRRDIRELARRLRRRGYRVDLNLSEGRTPEDHHVDLPPFSDTHLRTALGGYTITSFALIVERPRVGGPERFRLRWPFGSRGPAR